jgi:prevent-host-death family protein
MTKTVTVHDAQTQLLKLLSFTMEGNEIIIVKDDKPLARLVPISSTTRSRIAGLNKGKIWMSDDFNAPLPDEFWAGSR